MSKHPHYDLIVKWASDPERWEWRGNMDAGWRPTGTSSAALDVEGRGRFRLIDRYAEPITEEPEDGALVFGVSPQTHSDLAAALTWRGTAKERTCLRRRLLYRTREAAEARAREIIESGGGEV